MLDFTHEAYIKYILAIKRLFGESIITFNEYFQADPKPRCFCIIRHDVDRKPGHALRMAQIENKHGIRSTYYFRAKSNVFNKLIIKEIQSLGHDIGYHYESLSDTNGDFRAALMDFKKNLDRFREFVPIATIAMHGRPFKPQDNRDMWKGAGNHSILRELGLLGEVYLDIDYTDIAYINDSGRNWYSRKSNLRDKVDSDIKVEFTGGDKLLNYLKNKPHDKLVFQIHPERWSGNFGGYIIQFCFDFTVNQVKKLIK